MKQLMPRIVVYRGNGTNFYDWLIANVTNKCAWRIEPPVRLSPELATMSTRDRKVCSQLQAAESSDIKRLGYISARLFVVDSALPQDTLSVDYEK